MNAVIKDKTEPTAAPTEERKSKTDWERLKNMTDDEIREAALSDPDSAPLLTEESAKRYKPRQPRIKRT
jgi:hypothetical protein